MADENTPTPAEQATPQGVPLTINAQYIKDLSFEVPNAPAVFGEIQTQSPDINIDISVNARPFSEEMFEVELAITANCKVGENTGFILELIYSGTFTLNVPEEHRQPVLMIECPRILFPFARNILAEVTRDGGFPPVMLGMVDFVQMYQRRVQEQGEQSEQPTDAS